MVSLISFIVLLSIVVFVHEWGHFITGRLLGIGVERFAIGFGPAIFKKTWHGVEYRLNWIPFGGYVKFVGDEPGQPVPDELRSTAFNTAPVYKRAATAFAGPFMTLVLAVALFCVIFCAGYQVPSAYLADIVMGSPAEEAGLLPGDQVVAIDGRPTQFWDDLDEAVSKAIGRTLTLTVEREGERLDIPVTPKSNVGMNLFGFDEERGIIGVSRYGNRAWVGVSDPASPAAQAGLQTGDLVLSINDRPITFFKDLDRQLGNMSDQPLKITVARGLENVTSLEPTASFVAEIPANPEQPYTSIHELGIAVGELFIHEVTPESPAAKAGFQINDRIVKINGEEIYMWDEFTAFVRENPEKPITVTVLRDGGEVDIDATPEKVSSRDILGNVSEHGYLGLSPLLQYTAPKMITERYYNPIKIVQRGWQESWRWTVVTIKGFYFLIIGKAPAKSLGGPIFIAQLAGQSARMGWVPFLFFMAVISLNLAFINLAPVPILDGGHLLLLSIEGIRRKPISDRAIGIAQRIGLTLLGALILLVFYIDFSRVWFDIKDHFLQ